MDQKRFLLALVLSAAILFGWEYFLRRTTPQQQPQNNTAQQSTDNQQTVAQESSQPQPQQQPDTSANVEPAATVADVPQRLLTVESPLYKVQIDNRGAVATSWVIKVIKRENEAERPLYSVAGTKQSPKELELISQRGLKEEPRQAPLRFLTGDDTLDALLASRNYSVGGVEGDSGDARIELKPGEQRRIEFTLRDPLTGLDVTKAITFYADSYSVDLEARAARGEQRLSDIKLAIGPNIGDQGISHYTFYSVAPEGVYNVVNAGTSRPYAATVHKNKETPDRLNVSGPVDWAAVGDTYFAMVAVPSRPTQGLEYRTTKYEQEVDGKKEERFLITGLLSIPADGTRTRIYVGPKDHYLLDSVSKEVSSAVGRAVDLENLIDYGWLSRVSRPLAVPILWSIRHLNAMTGSYGIAIILFTIIIYSLFFPLKWRSSRSMKKAAKLAPRMKEVQQKIKDLQGKSSGKANEAKLRELQMEQLRLMKEGNPLGGCLPILIQMPFLFALFRAITISIDFRQASFLWMPDLSAGDPWHLLPVLMAGSMVVLQLITPAPSADPLQRKMMAVMLPVMMLYMMWSAPAGLLVYWLVGNIVGFAQQMLINRMIKSEDDGEPPEKDKAETRQTKKLNTARVSQA